MTASQAQEPGPGAAPARQTSGSLNPAIGQPIATFPVYQREDADVAVSRAREAARWWGDLGWRERRARLLDWKSYLTGHMDELARLMHEETGKPADDATLEIILAIVHVDWAARHAAPEQLLPGGAGSRPATADRERSRMGPIGPRDPSVPG